MMMKPVTLILPKKICFGAGCLSGLPVDLEQAGFKNIFIIAFPQSSAIIESLTEAISKKGMRVIVNFSINKEPDSLLFNTVLRHAMDETPDVIVGFGGGSILDVAKLVAALISGEQTLTDVFGIGKLNKRNKFLVCIPTTAGTGSEVSPNAIVLDQTDNQKKGVISNHLVPDLVYIDPEVTISLPAYNTAISGLDALSHCLEAYTSKSAHPLLDLYALEGIRLISLNLIQAVKNGGDLSAREALLLGSYYGGLCLGPVNTAAVHALSYPLGSEFHIDHGLANAILLPHVMRFNYLYAPKRYADVAVALGAGSYPTYEATAMAGIDKVTDIIIKSGIPASLDKLHIPESCIPELAISALNVQRLMKNNIREVQIEDAIHIYKSAFEKNISST